jgi:hypothetical protein
VITHGRPVPITSYATEHPLTLVDGM